MKKITIILLLITVAVSAQKKVNCDRFLMILNNNRILAQKNNAVGIIDFEGKIIAPFKYEKIYDISKYQISSKLFVIKNLETNEKELLNIENGNNILNNINNLLDVFINDEYAVIKTGESIYSAKSFYIDSLGNILFELPKNERKQSYLASAPHENLIRLFRYKPENYYISKKQEIIYYNLKGDKTINDTFKYFSGNFSNGLAINSIEKEGGYYYGFMDKNGNQKIDFKFSKPPTDFSDGMSRVESVEGNIGFINLSGEVVINPKYKDASSFYKGYALVQGKNNQWFLIDKKDNIIEEYSVISSFPYIAQNEQRTSYISILIDEGILAINSKYKRVMMNLKGEFVFEEKDFIGKNMTEVYNFKNGHVIYYQYNSKNTKKESRLMNKDGIDILVAEPSVF
jgi:hypothetical protein